MSAESRQQQGAPALSQDTRLRKSPSGVPEDHGKHLDVRVPDTPFVRRAVGVLVESKKGKAEGRKENRARSDCRSS